MTHGLITVERIAAAAGILLASWLTPAQALHPIPQPGSLILQAGGGWGFHAGMLADFEERFADRAADEGLTPDSASIRLEHTATHREASLQYFTGSSYSAGIMYLHRSVTQTMPGSQQYGEERRENLLNTHQLGPSCTFWRNGQDYNTAFTLAAFYATGTLHRATVLAAVAYDESAWLPLLARKQRIEGYGFGLKAGLYKFAGNGFSLSLGAGFDFVHYRVPRTAGLTYPATIDCADLNVTVTLGYASNVWQSAH